jgi:hypothetical protein
VQICRLCLPEDELLRTGVNPTLDRPPQHAGIGIVDEAAALLTLPHTGGQVVDQDPVAILGPGVEAADVVARRNLCPGKLGRWEGTGLTYFNAHGRTFLQMGGLLVQPGRNCTPRSHYLQARTGLR